MCFSPLKSLKEFFFGKERYLTKMDDELAFVIECMSSDDEIDITRGDVIL